MIRFEKKTVAETAPKEAAKPRPDQAPEVPAEGKPKAAPRGARSKAAEPKDDDRLI